MRSTWLHVFGYLITLIIGIGVAVFYVRHQQQDAAVLDAQADGAVTLELIDLLLQDRVDEAIYLQTGEAEDYLTHAMVLGRRNTEDAELMVPLLDYADYLEEQRPGMWSNVFDSTRVDYERWLVDLK